MGEQLQFSFMKLFESKYVPPDYIKFYTIYQYDRIKFKKLLRKEIARLKPKSDEEFKEIQNRILIKCYIRDDKGHKKRDTDEKHIFRYRAMQNIFEQLYKLVKQVGIKSDLSFFGAINLYDEDEQAEIEGTKDLPVLERVKIHIKAIREIKNLAKVVKNSSYDF